jgi:hypothetical protein
VEKHQRRHDDLGDVDQQEEQPEAEEPPDRRQVGGRPGEQLARLPLAVEAHRELLQPLVEVVAHRSLDLEDRLVLDPAPPPDQERLEDAEPEHQEAEREDAAGVVVLDRAVDERLDDERDRNRPPTPVVRSRA